MRLVQTISTLSIYKIYLREHAISMEQEAMEILHVTNPIQLRLPQSSSSMATIRLEYYNNFAPGWNHFSTKHAIFKSANIFNYTTKSVDALF